MGPDVLANTLFSKWRSVILLVLSALDIFFLRILWKAQREENILATDPGAVRVNRNSHNSCLESTIHINMNKKIDWNKYTPFQQRVLKAICQIPPGKVWTYGEVAKKLGNPHLARAVGQALSKNKDAPEVPCHRVVGHKGMGGYSAGGGLKTKLKLLKQEGYKK